MRRAPARPVRACFAKLLQCCCPRTWPARDPGAMQCQAKTFLTLHIALFTPCTSHFTLALFALDTSSHLKSCELFSPHLSSSHLIPSLLTCHLNNFFSTVFTSSEHCQHTEAWDTDACTLYTGKASRKYLCTTKLSSSPQFFCSPKKFC